MALRLNWPDERYVRVYVRDTLDWLALSWHAQALYVQLTRKADRRGHIDLGRIGRRGVAALVGHPDMANVLDPALDELLKDGCLRLDGTSLVIPDFVEAQEAISSGKKRQRDYEERRRLGQAQGPNDASGPPDEASAPPDEASDNVTPGYSTAETGGNGKAPPRPATEEGFGDDLKEEYQAAERKRAAAAGRVSR